MEKKWPSLQSLSGAMEKKWPPLESCPQYVSGLIRPFARRFSWEDDEHIQDWYAQYGLGSTSKEIMDSDLQATKKFLHEMRATRAYGYETIPPRFFDSPLREKILGRRSSDSLFHSLFETLREKILGRPSPDSLFESLFEKTPDIILAHISERTGRPYELRL